MTTALYTHPICLKHEMGEYHPEKPARIHAIQDLLTSSGTDRYLDFREPPEAAIEDIARAHVIDMIDDARNNIPEVGHHHPLGGTLLNAYSWKAALRAAGAAVAATDAVFAGELDNAFCLVRPIGHHSTASEAMGFCVFNNVAIAALRAIKVHGLERVAIVDTDVHHGNGTEAIFAHEPRVMMVSYYQEYLYPFSGNERQRSHMVNVPVPAGTDGAVIRQVVTEKWLPALHHHRPQMIFISAGFDAHRDDPLGGMSLVADDYAWITRQIMAVAKEHAGGRIVSFLEGGYNLDALAESAVAHIRTLAGLEQE
ncbi:histone deacetylase family protein [Oxalobacter sp. OttesenSCG-928-P03]|nr:histone deacetylase family protein [Oxalobacter sp. OttesenSCG-928-P03]